MRQNGTILLPVDLSDACVPALHFACALTRAYDANLVLLHVNDELPAIWRFGWFGAKGKGAEKSLTNEEADLALQSWLESVGPIDIPLIRRVESGGAGAEIIRVAQELPADFVVLATHGNTGLQARCLGGTAYRVLRGLRCPVASVKPPDFGGVLLRMWEGVQLFGNSAEAANSMKRLSVFPPKRVIHPTDFSDASHHATQLAARMMRHSGGELTVLHVAPDDDRQDQASIDERMEQLCLQVEAMGGATPRLVTRRGNPASEVLREAVEQSADLVVMGSEGIGGLSVLSVGSTAARVVRQASCPVITLRADTSLRAIDREFRKVDASLSLAILRSPDVEAEAAGIDDLVRDRQADHFLGYYTRVGFEHALEEYGFLRALRDRGYEDLRTTFDLTDSFEQTFRVYYGPEDDRDHLLIESTLRLSAIEVPRDDDNVKRLPVLVVSWLCMQDPKGEFSARKPPMPDQAYPGLGLGREILELFVLIAERLGKDALVNCPMHLHNARYYHDKFRFLDPRMEGRLAAMLRDTADVTLADASWALQLGCLMDAQTGEAVRWEGKEQVFPMTEELRSYFEGGDYRREVWTAARQERFEIDWDRFRRCVSFPPQD